MVAVEVTAEEATILRRQWGDPERRTLFLRLCLEARQKFGLVFVEWKQGTEVLSSAHA